MNREDRMLEYLKTHRFITTRDAVTELGNCDGRKTISELRRKGYNIIGTRVKGKNRYGDGVSYMRYSLVESKGE